MTTETNQIHRIIQELQAAWLAGNGTQFAAAFAPHARFVVFDGTTLTGPAEIANFHQRFFDRQPGSALDIHIEEIRLVAPGVWLTWTKGGIRKPEGSFGESVQLFVFREQGGHLAIEAFQNTRLRPVTDPHSAEVWRQFDQLWNNLSRDPN